MPENLIDTPCVRSTTVAGKVIPLGLMETLTRAGELSGIAGFDPVTSLASMYALAAIAKKALIEDTPDDEPSDREAMWWNDSWEEHLRRVDDHFTRSRDLYNVDTFLQANDVTFEKVVDFRRLLSPSFGDKKKGVPPTLSPAEMAWALTGVHQTAHGRVTAHNGVTAAVKGTYVTGGPLVASARIFVNAPTLLDQIKATPAAFKDDDFLGWEVPAGKKMSPEATGWLSVTTRQYLRLKVLRDDQGNLIALQAGKGDTLDRDSIESQDTAVLKAKSGVYLTANDHIGGYVSSEQVLESLTTSVPEVLGRYDHWKGGGIDRVPVRVVMPRLGKSNTLLHGCLDYRFDIPESLLHGDTASQMVDHIRVLREVYQKCGNAIRTYASTLTAVRSAKGDVRKFPALHDALPGYTRDADAALASAIRSLADTDPLGVVRDFRGRDKHPDEKDFVDTSLAAVVRNHCDILDSQAPVSVHLPRPGKFGAESYSSIARRKLNTVLGEIKEEG